MQGQTGWQSGTLLTKQQGADGYKPKLQPSVEDRTGDRPLAEHVKDPGFDLKPCKSNDKQQQKDLQNLFNEKKSSELYLKPNAMRLENGWWHDAKGQWRL